MPKKETKKYDVMWAEEREEVIDQKRKSPKKKQKRKKKWCEIRQKGWRGLVREVLGCELVDEAIEMMGRNEKNERWM